MVQSTNKTLGVRGRRRRGESRFGSLIMMIIPLVLSGFTHMWNPTGFPSIHLDEGSYMRKAIIMLEGWSVEDSTDISTPELFRHPFFGQIFLAGALALLNYESYIDSPTEDSDAIDSIYRLPRLVIGSLSIVDTFLIYKIAEHRYGKKAAFIAAILFAVMPVGWLIRRIMLESIQLPFILASVLFASHLGGTNPSTNSNSVNRQRILIVAAGICLGIAIFTKVPAISVMPVVGVMILRAKGNSSRGSKLLIWLIPVILIPSIWPIQAMMTDEFDTWLKSVIWQTNRHDQPLSTSLNILLKLDVVSFILGACGIIYSAIKRDFLLLLWLVPFLIFFQLIGYVSYFHLIPLVPIWSIAAGKGLADLSQKIGARWRKMQGALPYIICAEIGIFGLVITSVLIMTDVNSTHLQAIAYVNQLVPDTTPHTPRSERITFVGDTTFAWISHYVYDKNHDYRSLWSDNKETDNLLLVVDDRYRKIMAEDSVDGERLRNYFNQTQTIAVFDGFHPSDITENAYIRYNLERNIQEGAIEIRSNFR